MKNEKPFEVYDELTNKSLLINATSLEEAELISEGIDFNDYNDSEEI